MKQREKNGHIHGMKTFFGIHSGRKKKSGILQWKDDWNCMFIRMQKESWFTTGMGMTAGATDYIDTVMPVPVTDIQKIADIFCISNTMRFFHIYHLKTQTVGYDCLRENI